MSRNAKEEFPRKEFGTVLCAEIDCTPFRFEDNEGEYVELRLKVGHTEEQFDEFLNNLDFEYDSGFGSQELYGIIWLTDGTYFTRGEYDGSEWWEYHRVPQIPEYLNNPFIPTQQPRGFSF